MYIAEVGFVDFKQTATSTLSRIPTTIIYENIAKPLLDIQDLHDNNYAIVTMISGQQMKAAVDKGRLFWY